MLASGIQQSDSAIHSIYNSVLSAKPKLPVCPSLTHPWQPQVWSLCLWVCRNAHFKKLFTDINLIKIHNIPLWYPYQLRFETVVLVSSTSLSWSWPEIHDFSSTRDFLTGFSTLLPFIIKGRGTNVVPGLPPLLYSSLSRTILKGPQGPCVPGGAA